MIAINELEARRRRIIDELDKLDSAINAVKAYVTAYAPDMLEQAAPVQAEPRRRLRMLTAKLASVAPTITERTANAAWEAIVDASRPLSLGEIEAAVVAAGVPLGGTENPRNVIGARLYNSKRFISTPHGYWLADEPLPSTSEVEPKGSHETGALNGHTASAPEAGKAPTFRSDDQNTIF